MAYSSDLIERIINAILNGKTIQEMSRILDIHHNTISLWMKAYDDEKRVTTKAYHRQKPYKVDWKKGVDFAKPHSDWTQGEYAEHFGLSQRQICKILQRHDITHKKTLTYEEQNIEKIETFKCAFEKIKDKAKIIYLDESGITKKINKTEGYAPRGKKLQGKIKGKREKKINIIAGLCQKQVIAPCCYRHAMNKTRFNHYIQVKRLPVVEPGSMFIMGNAPFHRLGDDTKRIKKNNAMHGILFTALFT